MCIHHLTDIRTAMVLLIHFFNRIDMTNSLDSEGGQQPLREVESIRRKRPIISYQPLSYITKKRRSRKPVSVLICHLSSQPTPWHRAGSPHLPVYLVLQVPVPYPSCIAAERREPLTRVFTLGLPEGRPVIFCYGRRKVTSTCAFRSGMPFPVRTFLSCERQKRPTFF